MLSWSVVHARNAVHVQRRSKRLRHSWKSGGWQPSFVRYALNNMEEDISEFSGISSFILFFCYCPTLLGSGFRIARNAPVSFPLQFLRARLMDSLLYVISQKCGIQFITAKPINVPDKGLPFWVQYQVYEYEAIKKGCQSVAPLWC